MAIILKQSTAYTFRLGPFVDKTDGNTQENSLTIAYTDVLLSKAGGALSAKNDTTALTSTGANAHYTCVLNTTDTNTLGGLRVWCHISADALPVYKDFQVVPANVYDSLVAGSDNLQVDTTQVGGTSQTARDLGASVLLSSGTGTGQLDFTSGVVKANLAQILGTALTETAGQIAAAFKKFFDKAAPTGTINSLPDAVPGAAGGVFIAGSNAATSVTTALTANITGNLSGSVGSVTGAVGSVTGAVGSVTGDVGGNVTGSVGSLGAQAKLDVNAEVDSALDTPIPVSPTADSINERIKTMDAADIPGRLPAALTGAGNMKSDALAINASTTAAAQLAKSAATIVSGTAITGTLSTTQMTTDLTEATNDHYKGRIIIWTSGALQNQATDITAYDGTGKMLTYTATTEAPANTDTFIIV